VFFASHCYKADTNSPVLSTAGRSLHIQLAGWRISFYKYQRPWREVPRNESNHHLDHITLITVAVSDAKLIGWLGKYIVFIRVPVQIFLEHLKICAFEVFAA
jgi:hypothetical protein